MCRWSPPTPAASASWRPGDPAVAILPRDAEPDQFAAVLADRATTPIAATLPVHFTRGTMAARYTWLYCAGPRRRAATGYEATGCS